MEIKKQIQEQRDFFIAGKTRSLVFRRKALSDLRLAVKSRQAEIVEALRKDFGKPEFETLTNEILVSLQEINHARENLKSWMRPKSIQTGMLNIPSTGYTIQEPFGVSLIISPWNFPFFLVIAPLVGAIASGNCSIIKPSENTPNTSRLIKEMIEKLYDPSFIRVILGDQTVGAELLKERFDFIFFTGSPRVGKIVMKAAAENLTPLVLELGGKSPCVVHYDSNPKVAARRIAWGKFLNAGQVCISPDYILVHEKIKESFVAELKKNFDVFLNSDGGEEYSRIINNAAFQRLRSYLKDGKILIGGGSNEELLTIEPTLLEVQDLESRIMNEEVFGPVLPMISYKNIEGAIEKIRKLPRPMVVYYFGKSKRLQRIAIKNISSGDICINDTLMHFASPGIPVGGIGNSGMGKYHGKDSFLAFSHKRSVLKKSQGLENPLRYPPYGKKLSFLKKWINFYY
jgi:aldehyde dehydrogenase (NAD+)